VDISVGGAWGGRSGDCAYAGEAAIQAFAVYDASFFAGGADGEPVAAEGAGHFDLAASLRDNRLDSDALCAADSFYEARAGREQIRLLPWSGQLDVDGVFGRFRKLFE
jgi:hypothetical protein